MIYKSKEGEEAFLRIYDEALQELRLTTQECEVNTRFGPTHVVMTGPEDAPPIFMLHGGNTVNAETLGWYLPLAEHYRIYAPDLIGHPGKSAQVRLSTKDLSYGEWAADVVNALELGPVPFLGTSYGGSITLYTAAVAPKLLSKAILVVSGSIASASSLSMALKILWPLMTYKMLGSRKRLAAVVKPIMAEPSETNLDVMAAVFKHLKMNDLLPPLSDEQLQRLQAPTLVFAAENDIFFPARKVLPRVKRVFANLVAVEELEKSQHYPTVAHRAFINQRIHAFLQT